MLYNVTPDFERVDHCFIVRTVAPNLFSVGV